ncbi:hypothetical protein AAG906_021555 [Vitis piasezkii]
MASNRLLVSGFSDSSFFSFNLVFIAVVPTPYSFFTRKLNIEFDTKDLGSFNYFLGLEATSTTNGLFLTSLFTLPWLFLSICLLMVLCFRILLFTDLFVGALQYLTITRLNIAHVVNFVSQFLHSPTEDHFLAIKRILRYVKGTLHFGLNFHPSATPVALVSYSDANWVGCLDTRCSTSGYFIYLADNLVS